MDSLIQLSQGHHSCIAEFFVLQKEKENTGGGGGGGGYIIINKNGKNA